MMMSGEFEIIEVKSDRSEVEMSRGHKLAIQLLMLLLVDVLWVMATEITKHLFTVERYDKPFLISYIRCSSLAVHLLVAAWLRRPWRDKNALTTDLNANGDDYTVIDPVAEDDNFYTDTIDLSLSAATFVPLRSSTGGGQDTSGTESEHEQQHKRTVRFNRVAEVRALSGSGVACRMAAAARLSWAASRRAAVAAQRRRTALTLRRIASRAAKAAPLYVACQCTWSWWIHAAAMEQSSASCNWSLVGAAGVTLGVTLAAVISRILIAIRSVSQPPSSPNEQNISKTGTLTQITALLLVAFTALGILMFSNLGSCLTGRIPFLLSICAFASGIFHALFTCIPRVHARPIAHPRPRLYSLIDLHLFLGSVGLVSMVCWWWVVGAAALLEAEHPSPPTRRQLLIMLLDALLGNVLLDSILLRICSMSSAVCASGTLPILVISHWILLHVNRAGPITSAEIITGSVCAVALSVSLLLLFLGAGRDPIYSAVLKTKRFLLRSRALKLAVSDVEQSESLIEGNSSSPDDDHES